VNWVVGRDTYTLVFQLMVIPLAGLDFTSSIKSVQTPVMMLNVHHGG
jgi:hypothetical protein